ncbi:MAG: isoprenylcysteine carboxylmethyltransferase family protein [Deltaproteobacteria bacterium]|nr:isoprenylcysteine carboxylmethyltransferase family protein [Deltaproteobacteria bacterium]
MAATHPWTRALLQAAVAVPLAGGCLLGTAGTLDWWNAWVFLGFMLGLSALMGWIFSRSPGLAEERDTARARARSWDTVLVPVLGAVLPLLALVLAGLDRRHGWSGPVPPVVSLAGLLAMLAGTALTAWAMDTNRFFSSHVRIQADRGHVVVSAGPYGVVRHPGYAGSLVYNLAVPLLLGSWVALVPVAAFVLVTLVRTALEDRVLRAELAGYRDYAAAVRHRLVPGVW